MQVSLQRLEDPTRIDFEVDFQIDEADIEIIDDSCSARAHVDSLVDGLEAPVELERMPEHRALGPADRR